MVPRKLRIGLMLDGYEVPAWFYSALQRLLASGCGDVRSIIINRKVTRAESTVVGLLRNCRQLVYLACTRVDAKIFKSSRDAFEVSDVRQLVGTALRLDILPVQEGEFQTVATNDVNKIRSMDLDIIVKNGFGSLRGEILNASRYGVWAYRYGDDVSREGRPPGFWEVAEGCTETGVRLEILGDDRTPMTVLYQSWFPTYQLSVTKNSNGCHWMAAVFLARQVKRLHYLGEEKFFAEVRKHNANAQINGKPIYGRPSNMQALVVGLRLVGRATRKVVRYVFYRKQWILMLDSGTGLSTSFPRFRKILPPKDRLWADPFVVFHDNKYTLFIEELLYKKGRGHIAAIEIDNHGELGNPCPVIEESYHLSYPFILRWSDRYYMVPETSSAGAVRLYECEQFPNRWTFKMTLINNIIAVDPTLFYLDGTWWMFVGVAENGMPSKSVELSLFHSKQLLSDEWTPHPMNPIVSDVRNARPAGRIIQKGGKLYRLAQDCSVGFGRAFQINEIVKLTKDRYEERKVERVTPEWDKTLLGVHTLNHDHNVTAIDGLIWRGRFLIAFICCKLSLGGEWVVGVF
jgi:hypothetical protein